MLVIAAGCTSDVRGGLREADADQIVVALDRAAIAADKHKEPSGQRFTVVVGSGDLARALALLAAERLPRAPVAGFDDLYAKSGLVVTASEERARAGAATAGELSRTLEGLPSVLKARVHVALPDSQRALDEPRAPAKASVLIERRDDAPALDETRIRTLVAGAVEGLEPAAVTVVQLAVATPRPWQRSLVRIGPIAVSAASVPALKAVLGVSLALDLLLALALVVLVRGRR